MLATVFDEKVAVGWGDLKDIAYKIKPTDGNIWSEYLGGAKRIIRGEEKPNRLTFTFDDGPDHRTTPLILDELEKRRIRATFFVNGWKFHPRTADGQENQAVLREIYRRGHYIGSHTFSHKDIANLDDDGWNTEVRQVEQLLKTIIGRRCWLFRPPFGHFDAQSYRRLEKEGYTTVMWNMDSMDWQARNPYEVFKKTKRVIEENPKGGILLFHDTNQSTVEAFPRILDWIEEHNERRRARGETALKIVGMENYIR